MGVGVLLEVGVEEGAAVVSVKADGSIVAVLDTCGDGRAGEAIDSGVAVTDPNGIIPQACSRSTMRYKIKNLLRTLAVYHNPQEGMKMLNQRECLAVVT